MPLLARASNTVRNKNILMLLLCLGFAVMFSYDGFIGYPRANDLAVKRWQQMFKDNEFRPPDEHLDAWTAALEHWPRWNNATPLQRNEMHQIHEQAKKTSKGDVKWHSPFDVDLQQYIAYGLGALVLVALWWIVHCQKRRATADETMVSPAPGISIPWQNITLVDNTRWKKSGIVEITYLDSAGQAKVAKFDDYELDREPLLQILDLLAEKADKAEFIPKEETAV